MSLTKRLMAELGQPCSDCGTWKRWNELVESRDGNDNDKAVCSNCLEKYNAKAELQQEVSQ